jgi:hypothetical protein
MLKFPRRQSEVTKTQLSDIQAVTELMRTMPRHAANIPRGQLCHVAPLVDSSSQPESNRPALIATSTMAHSVCENDSLQEWKEAGDQLCKMSVNMNQPYRFFHLKNVF